MTDFLPKEVRDGLKRAHKQALKKRNRLRVQVGDESYKVLRYWEKGFSLDADNVPPLRGLVDIYDGSKHLYQALIVASDKEDGEMRFEFKRSTATQDRAPLDFERDEDAPIALLPR